MNNESGSALQKASFVLLVFIAAALSYLIVRDRIRSQSRAAEPETAAATVPGNNSPRSAFNPAEMKSSFAPLRPRAETNVVRVFTNRPAPPTPANSPVAVRHQQDNAATLTLSPNVTANVPPAVPAAFTRGETSDRAPSIVGRVTLRGTPPPEKQVTLDAMCGQLHPAPMFTRHFVLGRDAGLGNVFVYVKEGALRDKSSQASVPLLDNVNCEFEPYVLGVRAGQPFTFRNSDPVLHNMHFLTQPGSGNREMNIAMPTRKYSVTKIFDKPEAFIKVKCDVHPWMFAYIGVVEHRWFTVTDNNGDFALPPGLPRGQYTIAAVHVKAGESVQKVIISDGAAPAISFTLDVPPILAQQAGH